MGEKNFGAKSGALALFFLAGVASAPLLGSVISNIGGYNLVLTFMACVAVVGLFFYLVANYFSRKKSPEQVT